MATPNIVKVDPPLSWRPDREEFLFVAWVEEEADAEPFNAVISATETTVAGFHPEHGPTVKWMREQFEGYATGRLENYRPVLEQMREWESPIVITAPPP